jgi:SM-20-related protein
MYQKMQLVSNMKTPETLEPIGHSIRVLDDFLPSAAYDELAELIANEPLVYGSRSNLRTDPHGHWSRSFVDACRMNLADVSSDLSRDERLAPLDRAWRFLRDTQLANDILIRCYLNGYTYGTDGYFHVDSQRLDESTTVVYMNNYWEPDWAGETVFLDARSEIAKSVLPKRNRAIIFPADVQHAGHGVSRKCTALRMTLIFKTRRRRSGNFERLSAFLRRAGAAKHGHTSGTLHDHLVRTFALLEARGLDENVCFGGGLHSAYGTNAYRHALLSQMDRANIVEEFGARADELASLFSMLERPKTFESPRELTEQAAVVELRGGQTMTLPRTTFDDLRKIECANLADQNQLSKYRTLSAIWHAK